MNAKTSDRRTNAHQHRTDAAARTRGGAVEFARFLQILEAEPGALESEDKRDKLFARPEAQRAMLEMARETREDFRSGRTTDITLIDDGRLAPK